MSDDLDWNKAIEDYDNRRKKEKEAKKMKKFKASPTIRASFVQGGQTGMVQQNIKPPPPPSPPGMNMIEYIYITMTEFYKMDIALIQVGIFVETIKENAKWYSVNRHKERNLKIHTSRGYPICGCGDIDNLEDIKKFLKDEGKEFCFAKQTEVKDDKCTERTITFCTNKELEGLAFYYDN